MKIATLDFETDPFCHGEIPYPFACGIYCGESDYREYWSNGRDKGTDVIEWAINALRLMDGYTVYAHNGGKFDFMYMLDYLDNPIKIINHRIVSAKIGGCELRDSFAILPVPLAAYQKDVIDYELFKKDKRQDNKADILHYLAKDCEYLYEVVSAFISEHSNKLTIGSAAMAELKKIHPFKRADAVHDERFRPYFFGGRVQAFSTGIFDFADKPAKYIDVNSMYPAAMINYAHPARECEFYGASTVNKVFDKCTGLIDGGGMYFASIVASNNGALPFRDEKGGITFDRRHGNFFACSHEIQAALRLGLIEIEHVEKLYHYPITQKFDTFILSNYEKRLQAKADGLAAYVLLYKLIMNSAYGKFAQNPLKYRDYRLERIDNPEYDGARLIADGWELMSDHGNWELWEKPSPGKNYYDVAIAASITSAARSTLLEALHAVEEPLYCDTDSIICRDTLGHLNISSSILGAWKIEAELTRAYIAGKKLYAVETTEQDADGRQIWKSASKGVRLSVDEILAVCRGDDVAYRQDAPKFGLDRSVQFICRTVRSEEKRTREKKSKNSSKTLRVPSAF